MVDKRFSHRTRRFYQRAWHRTVLFPGSGEPGERSAGKPGSTWQTSWELRSVVCALVLFAALGALPIERTAAEGATVTLDEGCSLFDGLGKLVTVDDKVKVENSAGVKFFSCHGIVAPSPTGKTVRYDSGSVPPGFGPYCRIGGLPTLDWNAVVTPSGHASITCRINGNAIDHTPEAKDSDGDGLPDKEERRLGTDPRSGDTDGDSCNDYEEVAYFYTDPLDPLSNCLPPLDSDGDGLPDDRETELGTDPTLWDTDGDSCGDYDEVEYSLTDPLDPLSNCFQDSDADGLTDADERAWGTDPLDPDTDDDAFSDFDEVMWGSDPLDSASHPPLDSDGDGLPDDQEVEIGTDPLNPDSDNDLCDDLAELNLGSDPWDSASPPPGVCQTLAAG